MHPTLGQGTEACLTVCSSPYPRGPLWVPYLESNTMVHQALCGVSGTLPQRPVDSAPRSLPHGVLVPFSTPRIGSASPLLGDFPGDLLPPLSAATLLFPSPAPPPWSSQNNLGHSSALNPPEGPPRNPIPEKEQQVPECGPAP